MWGLAKRLLIGRSLSRTVLIVALRYQLGVKILHVNAERNLYRVTPHGAAAVK